MRPLLLLALLFLAALPALASGADYRVTAQKIERKGPGFSVSVEYPKIAGLPPAVGEPFNHRQQMAAEDQVRSFVTQCADIRKESPQLPESLEFSLTTEVEPKHISPRLVTVLVTGYEFLGGAHGMPYFQTIAVDALDGRDLELQDMFKPNAPYLQTISKVAIAQLQKRASELDTTADWIARGAAPEAVNFQVFWPGEDGLHILFPNYSVAPYSGGAPEVVIPYSALQGMLNDRYFD